MEPSGDAVKEAPGLQKPAAPRRAFGRHFEGWQLGAITVGLVLAAALLAVPRAAVPGVFPVPLVDVAGERAESARFEELADRAAREGLPFETRAVGDALRRMGLVLAGRASAGDLSHQQRVLRERVQRALAVGQQAALLRLCAVQARLFVRAAREHPFQGKVGDELAALGGDFVARATHNGWITSGGWRGSEDELQALFVMRWLELTRLRQEPELRPTLTQLRRYYRFLLLYPERGRGADPPRVERAQLRLRYVEALAQKDHDYPADLARGSLLAELGGTSASTQALTAHLARPAGAQWTLRARNYLLHAADGRTGP